MLTVRVSRPAVRAAGLIHMKTALPGPLFVGMLIVSAALAAQPRNERLASRIDQLFHQVFSRDRALPDAHVKALYLRYGLPRIAEVGEPESYEFVALLSSQPMELLAEVAPKIKEAAAQKDLPEDAAIYFAANFRLQRAKADAKTRPPANPDLASEIERLVQTDQAVRQRRGFDLQKMMETDTRLAGPMRSIFERYGVPTFEMVGPKAASDFIVMVQHQSAEFRARVLPRLKEAVDAGQSDPALYAMVYDRAQRDLGKDQLYGETLECRTGESLHEAPILDEAHVNQRRAELSLVRLELYLKLVVENSPQLCAAVAKK